MTSAHTTKLTFTILRTTILMAVVAALLFATPHGALAAAPERPTDLTAAATHHDTVSLTWNHPDPATVDHYQVLSRRVDSGTGLTQVGTSTTTSFEHDGLEPESTYFYRVKPVNSAGEEGQRSARAEATTPADATPAPEPDPTPVPDPTPAQPQRNDDDDQGNIARSSHNVLVTNTGETVNLTSASSAFLAQRVTTGPNAFGYTIAEVGVFISNIGPTTTTVVSIRENDSSNTPGDLVATLDNPATFTNDALNMFTAPSNTTIDGESTHYWITVNDGLTSNRGNFRGTTGDGQTGETGWSIGNARLWRSSESSAWNTDSVNLVISVRGSARTSTASDDATLTDLELEGAGGETITLSPEFAQGTTTYTAAVANRIETVTLSATKNDANATVVITSDDDDATPGEAELDLSVGANTLTVTVTAEDASTQTYTVTATRATAPPAPTDCPTDTDWCATLVLGYIPISSAQFTTEQFGYFSDSNFGDLSSATFSHGGISYTVSTIFRVKATRDSDSVVQSDNITFTVSPELPDGVVLQLDTRTFTVDADSEGTSTGQEQWDIRADPPVWTDGQHVTVSLKLTSNDATLSTLVLQDASDDSVLTFDPTFDPATLSYSVEVAHDVDEVTVTPTLNDTSASYEIQDDEGATLTDVDTTQDDFQVSISPGPNTINVVITGADGHTTQTYKVTVQRINILVSNIDQATAVATSVGNNGSAQIKHAQKFTTGSNTSGYTLYDVKLFLDSSASSEPIVTVNTADGNNPDTLLYNLTAKDSSLTLDGPRRFTANAGATLEASTSYFIVAANGNTTNSTQARYNLYLTDSNAEDSTGLSDWSITDSGRTGNPNWSGTPSNRAFNIQVRGTVTPASDDAKLSTLVLQDASDDSVLTLDPTFDPATLEYGATVGRGVGEITIIPTPNDTDADYEIQDGDGTALTDADTTQDEFQVSIARGLNTIQVEVTAEDATTQTYTVTVTRPRILVSSTGQTSGGSTETGNHAGSQTKHAQKFTTGSNPAGYTLDEVRIYIGSNGNAAAPVITVNSGSGNNPGAVLYPMTNPATITDAATNTFTAPSGATLEADTSYFVVMENSNTNDDPNALYQVGITTSNGEDSTGLSDWDIDDTGRTGTPGWSATSGNVAFRIQVRGTVDVDPDAATLPELSFQSINISVDEDGSQAALAVELSQTSADTVTVDYATSDITAEAGDDYTETSGTLTFTAGETVMAIIVPILDDAIYEPTERFDVTLSNPTGATLPAFPGARVNIAEDESPPTASITNVTVDEGAGTMTVALNLSHESSKPTVYLATPSDVGGTATLGTDYVNFISGTQKSITVPAGDTQASLDITITDDAAAESSETITIHWEIDPTGVNGAATPDVINFTGTITDNDSTVSSDATLRALAVRDDAQNRTLTPGFTPGTYAYAAQLVNAATTATLTATPNHAEAEVTNVTLAGTAIADTNLTDGITVPSLVVGDNVIVVTVTAQDNTTQDYTVTLTRAPALPAVNIVPSNWSLKPAGLSAGEFRLIFLSSTKHNAESSNIGTYNTFVQNRAAAGHADIWDYSSAFKVVGCTADVDARDNTGTTHTSADRGVPIYWLDGNKVADNYQDFYDGTWDDEANDRNESGNDAHDTSQSSNYPYTGCDHNGTESISGNSLALGKNAVRTGEPNSSIGTRGPLQGAGSSTSDGTRPFYGLSSVFQVDATSDVNLSIAPASATEGDDIVFTVNLSGTSADDVTFDYATSIKSDDNSESNDFTATSGTGTITAGSTYTTITVPTHDDGHNDSTSSYEGDETFTVTISNPTLAGISQATAKGTIIDDERLPTVKFTSSDRLTTEDAGHITNFLTFDVVPPGEQTSYISFTSSGTATAGQDYNIQNTTLTVNANINSITTNIIMVNDNVAELDETAIITVVAASANIQVDPDFSTRTLTIQDNDEHPTLSFTSETYNVNENAGHAVLTVNKTGDSSFPVHVDYETVSRNLAIAGDDYVATSGTLTFQPEEFSKTISVPIIDNNIYRDFGQRFNVELIYSSQSNDQNVPSVGIDTAVVIIINDDPVPTASMANVTANERAGTMTVTLRLSHPSSQDISYRTPDNSEYRGGTATFEVDYDIQYDGSNPAIITVPAGQLTRSFDITLIDDDLEEPDEIVELVWLKVSSSQATPDQLTFVGTITDPPVCDALGNLENTIIVKNLTGEITQAGQSQFHRIKLDPYRSYLIEAIGQVGEDMLGVEEHPNLTLSNPDIPAIWNARATSRWTTYGDRNDGDQPKNVIRRFLDSDYRTYKVEVNSGTGGTGTYQLKIRENNICRLDENDNAHYQWAGGPKGYPQGSDLPAGIGGRQVLLTGTDWGNDNITRPEMHHVLGDNWNSDRDEDWIGVDLEQGEEYTVRLRTKNSLPERLQATQLKILGMRDANGNNISGTESAGAAGKKVFLTDFEAPSTGRFHIAVGSEGNDRTGTYWLSIFKQLPE